MSQPAVAEKPTAGTRRPSRRRLSTSARWAIVFVAIFVVYLSGPARSESDEFFGYATANSIVHDGTLDLSGFRPPNDYRIVGSAGLLSGFGSDHPNRAADLSKDYRVARVNGRLLDYFPWTGALFATPFVLALDAPHAVGIGPGAEKLGLKGVLLVEEIVGSLLAAGAAVLLGLAAAEFARDRARRFRVGLAVALLFAFASSAWSTVSRDLSQHAPSVLFLAGAMYACARITRDDRRLPVALCLGAALAAAYISRPTNAVFVVAVTVWLVARHRSRLPAFVAGGALVSLPWFLVTHAQYGTWQQPYFSANRLELHSAYGEALAGNLVSPTRGLLLYSPALVALAFAGVVVLLRRSGDYSASTRLLGTLLAAAVVASWLAVSAYPFWWAGNSYGPRLLTDAGVVLAFLATPAVERIFGWFEEPATMTTASRVAAGGLAVLLAWSVFVHAQGGYFTESTCWNSNHGTTAAPDQLWNWSDPQFLAGVKSIPTLTISDFVVGRCPSHHRS